VLLLLAFASVLITLTFTYLLCKQKVKQRSQLRSRRYNSELPLSRRDYHRRNRRRHYESDGNYAFIGDMSCRFNALSAYIRCAVNPKGPCEGCRHFEQKE
jgi:hypothetical protein